MRDNWNTEQRWGKQRALVKKITNITNRAVPGKRGAHLRFMNQKISGAGADNLQSDDIDKYLVDQPSANNWTPTGTGLVNHVLKPLVYDVIDSGKKLERPLLVIMTTDGCPWCQEDAQDGVSDKISVEYDRFRDAIVNCMKYLEEKHYRRDSKIPAYPA